MHNKLLIVMHSMESRLLAAPRGHPPAARDDAHLCKMNRWSRRDRRRKPRTTRSESWLGVDDWPTPPEGRPVAMDVHRPCNLPSSSSPPLAGLYSFLASFTRAAVDRASRAADLALRYTMSALRAVNEDGVARGEPIFPNQASSIRPAGPPRRLPGVSAARPRKGCPQEEMEA